MRSRSSEFTEKYQKPYEQSWDRWMGELGELTVPNGDGNDRPIEPKDILALVNMPLQKAREQAESVFGSFANDVMDARKEIRGLFESQQKALADARTGGAERIAAMQKEAQARQQAATNEIATMWQQFNEAAVADEKFGKLLRPIDGDEEGNKRLKIGYEIADRAFSADPRDPRLSPEQRKEVVKLHSAIRHRSAAFGRVAYQYELATKEIATLKAELAKFKSAEPGKGEGVREKPEGGGTARDSVFGALRKIAGQ